MIGRITRPPVRRRTSRTTAAADPPARLPTTALTTVRLSGSIAVRSQQSRRVVGFVVLLSPPDERPRLIELDFVRRGGESDGLGVDARESAGLAGIDPFDHVSGDGVRRDGGESASNRGAPLRSEKRVLQVEQRGRRRRSTGPYRIGTVRFPRPRVPKSEQPTLSQQKRVRSSATTKARNEDGDR